MSSLSSSSSPADKLKSEILRLKSPGRSATAVIQDWVNQGHKVSVPELRRISIQLLKSKRFNHALQVRLSFCLLKKCRHFHT
jgi:hypothetical protein